MRELETIASKSTNVSPGRRIETSSAYARQEDMTHNTLFVLGLGLAGAIAGNMLALVLVC
jgi:hypothetical protein